MTKFHLEKVDGIRGIAILLVLTYHTLFILFPGFEATTYNTHGILELDGMSAVALNMNPVAQGWIGVELFLVISGFLIHLIYLKNGSRFESRSFFSKRFWRIYPPYLIVMMVFFLGSLDTSAYGIKSLLSHVFMVHNFSDTTIFSINPSFWSIALECQLYLLYPVYLYMINRMGDDKSFLLVTLLHVVLSAAAIIYNINDFFYIGFVLRFWFVWCFGALLANHFYQGKRVFSRPLIWFLFAYPLVFILKLYIYTRYLTLIPATIACVAFVEMVLYSTIMDKNLLFRRIFTVLSFIGLVSYSIYLIHQPILDYLLVLFDPNTGNRYFNMSISSLLTWTAIVLMSYLIYRTLETKSIQFGQRIRKKVKMPLQTPITEAIVDNGSGNQPRLQ